MLIATEIGGELNILYNGEPAELMVELANLSRLVLRDISKDKRSFDDLANKLFYEITQCDEFGPLDREKDTHE